MKKILIVDDDERFASGLAEILRLKDCDVAIVSGVAAGRAALESDPPQLLLLDLMLPDGSGLELLAELEGRQPERVALMTGHDAVKSYVKNVAGPQVTYLTKPVDSKVVLQLVDDLDEDEETADGGANFGLLIGESDCMQAVYEQIRRVAPSDSTVLIQGESGTGKELVAEALHRASGRSGKFVPVNCGGLTAELVASELFGHDKGSFTGATKRHAGYFERAATGTLFLDEVTEMPIDMQTQLLRVLETGKYSRVGGEREIDCEARVIAATNRMPEEAVREGQLREDLYFRLQVFPIQMPALSQRSGDIEILATHFLQELNRRHGTGSVFADDFFTKLSVHTWPGNVRELKNLVHRAYIMRDEDVLAAPDQLESPLQDAPAPAVGQSISDVEKSLIMSTLEHYDGDKKAAAAVLGVSLKTLYNRLKAYEESD